jgi:hypothetical protein
MKTFYDYLSIQAGDVEDIDQIVEKYGQSLERMTEEDKTWMMYKLANLVDDDRNELPSGEITAEIKTFEHLPKTIKLGAIEALAGQLRIGLHLPAAEAKDDDQ